MEGRAIARPDVRGLPDGTSGRCPFNGGAEQLLGRTSSEVSEVAQVLRPSMEGRAIARPDQVLVERLGEGLAPSMEGRAIARPDWSRPGGFLHWAGRLQWRAEQLLGRTGPTAGGAGFNIVPSMEGRAIARPGRPAGAPLQGEQQPTFNGGPSNCSAGRDQNEHGHGDYQQPSMEGRAIARPDMAQPTAIAATFASLQWRAEQLLGRTSP